MCLFCLLQSFLTSDAEAGGQRGEDSSENPKISARMAAAGGSALLGTRRRQEAGGEQVLPAVKGTVV